MTTKVVLVGSPTHTSVTVAPDPIVKGGAAAPFVVARVPEVTTVIVIAVPVLFRKTQYMPGRYPLPLTLIDVGVPLCTLKYVPDVVAVRSRRVGDTIVLVTRRVFVL
jgi:hypothetical protein